MNRISMLAALLVLFICLPVLAQGSGDAVDYSSTPRDEIPVAYTWNLEEMYPDQTAWREGFADLQQKLPKLKKKAEVWTESAKKAYDFFSYMDLMEQQFMRLSQYASLKSVGEITNSTYTTMSGEVDALGVDFNLINSGLREQILDLGEKTFASYLKKEPRLRDFEFGIRDVFRRAAHMLSEEEQRIVDMTGIFSGSSYTLFNMLNDSEIPNPTITLADGSDVTLNRAAYYRIMDSKVREDRILASQTYWENQLKFANSLAVTLDSGCKQHLFHAQTHKYDSCLEASLFAENIDTKVYMNTIKQVRSRADLLQRYLTLKKKMMGLDELRYEDAAANAVAAIEKEYTWDQAEDIITAAFKPLGPEYGAVLKRAFNERWMDRYPNKDKQSGAFSSMVYGVHPYIKMNFQGQYSEVGTLAHELGHAVQSYLSAEYQPHSLHDFPGYISEVASTFNEHMLNFHLLETDSDPLFRLYLLDEYMKRTRTLVFFSVMLSELELAMHETVENSGTVTGDFMNEKTLELVRHYYGHEQGVCDVPEYIQGVWSVYPHLFMDFYLLAYCNGYIASMAASEMVMTDESYRDHYLNYLKSGGSNYSLELLKIAKVDLSTDKPFELAFDRIEKLLGEMESLVDQLQADGRL
jgi:oligoendopeptidase F